MILILSTHGDNTTDYVIEWLNHFQYPVIRLNDNDIFKGLNIDISSQDLQIGETIINLSKINAVWFRKFGFFSASKCYNFFENRIKEDLDNYRFLNHLASEYSVIREFLLFKLKDKKWLANPKHAIVNKLIVLRYAMECDLKIPSTHIFSHKTKLINVMDIDKHIVKPLSQGINFGSTKEYFYSTLTSRVELDDLKTMPSLFFPTLTQSEIRKEFEIRSFYLVDKFYSIAIFSQKNEKTVVDFRNYDFEHPNKVTPFILPLDIEKKLIKLFKKLNLNTGSVDIIKSLDGEFYFLEINPGGQFGMIEGPCNIPLHKQVAIELIKMDKDE